MPTFITRSLALLAGALMAGSACAIDLKPVVIASRSDIVSLDPYAIEETLQLETASNVYEPLIARDAQHRLMAALAVSWEKTSPTVWRFKLRPGVTFHDGSPFTADDVVFSFERATGEGADIPNIMASIKAVRAIGRHAVEIELKRVMPQFLDTLPYWLIMSRSWSEKHGAERVRQGNGSDASFAALHANGTGPFRVIRRNPGVATEFERNPHYWSQVAGNVGSVRFVPIADDAARVQALLDGRADVINPLPRSARDDVLARPGLAVQEGPDLRVIFLGMAQADGGPFADLRVRQAVSLAVDVRQLVSQTMLGAATPVGVLVPQQVRGYARKLDRVAEVDLQRARSLLAEAGFPEGFAIPLDCPNNRYVNDAQVCEAVAAQLARIGIRVSVHAEDKATFFAKLFARKSRFYLLGATTGTGDAYSVLEPLMATYDGKNGGALNLGGYRSERINMLLREVDKEASLSHRHQLMEEVQAIHQRDVGHIPLYQLWLSWGRKKDIALVQTPEDGMPWREIRVGPGVH